MDTDTGILVAIITAITGGMIALVKVMLPYIGKGKRSDPPGASREVALPNPPPVPAVAVGVALHADGSGRYPALGDTGPQQPWEPQPLTRLENALTDLKTKVDTINPETFATKKDVEDVTKTMSDALSTRFDKQVEELEDKVESEARETRKHLSKIERSLGRLEGAVGKGGDD